jgi:hypothetical protein
VKVSKIASIEQKPKQYDFLVRMCVKELLLTISNIIIMPEGTYLKDVCRLCTSLQLSVTLTQI